MASIAGHDERFVRKLQMWKLNPWNPALSIQYGDDEDEEVPSDGNTQDIIPDTIKKYGSQLKQEKSLFRRFKTDILDSLDHSDRAHGVFNGLPDRYLYFMTKTAAVEFMRGEDIQKVYCRRHLNLHEGIKTQFLFNVAHDTPQNKLRDFLHDASDLLTDVWFICEGLWRTTI